MSAQISANWLQQHIGDPGVRIIETSVARESYNRAHIPGALWVDCHRELLSHGDDSSGLVIPPEQFAGLMSRLGCTPGMTVVWYGDRHSSFAIRGLWTMDYYRHRSPVYVLDGGRERWLAEKRPVAAGDEQVAPSDYPAPETSDLTYRATFEQTRDAISTADRLILDVRARDEYDGMNVRAARCGHIPGAVHVEWTDAVAGDNVLRSADELRALYESYGVTPDKEIIVHCQLGIRAAHTWFVLKHVLGYPRVRMYDGSWQEWGNRADTPVEI